MDVLRGRSASSREFEVRQGSFTGTAWGDPLLTTPNGIGMSTVYFSPGSRTHWHRHEGGQVLFIVSGEGLVVVRGGGVARVRAGDIVWTEPGEEHWHGACGNTFLVHTSVSVGSTSWLDEVNPDSYLDAQSA